MTNDPYGFLTPVRQSQTRALSTVAIAITMTLGALIWAISKNTEVGLLPTMMRPVVWLLFATVAMEIPFSLATPYSRLKRYLEKTQTILLYAVPLTTIGIILGAVSLSALRSPIPLITSYPDLILVPLLVPPLLIFGWEYRESSGKTFPNSSSAHKH